MKRNSFIGGIVFESAWCDYADFFGIFELGEILDACEYERIGTDRS